VCAAVVAAVAVLVAVYVPLPTWAQALIVVAPGCAIMLPAFLVDWKAAARAVHRRQEAGGDLESPAARNREEDEGDRDGS
jgi:hypothetical protein